LLGAIVEGVMQIVQLLSAPCVLVDEVGTRVDVVAIVGVALVMRQLIGGVCGMVVPWLVLLLRLLWGG
jgi:stage III sporulation protein SpoIIIAA